MIWFLLPWGIALEMENTTFKQSYNELVLETTNSYYGEDFWLVSNPFQNSNIWNKLLHHWSLWYYQMLTLHLTNLSLITAFPTQAGGWSFMQEKGLGTSSLRCWIGAFHVGIHNESKPSKPLGTCHANLHWHEGPSIGSEVFFSIFDTFLVKILYTLTKFHSPLKLDLTVVV